MAVLLVKQSTVGTGKDVILCAIVCAFVCKLYSYTKLHAQYMSCVHVLHMCCTCVMNKDLVHSSLCCKTVTLNCFVCVESF